MRVGQRCALAGDVVNNNRTLSAYESDSNCAKAAINLSGITH